MEGNPQAIPFVAASGLAVWRGTGLVDKGELTAGIVVVVLGLLTYAYVHRESPPS